MVTKGLIMKPNEKLSRMLHILIHIHLHQGAATSETIAHMLGTNAVVVRRMMAGLRNLGYVQATNGRGGGWQMRRDLSTLSVSDIYHALGEPGLLAMGTSKDHPDCPVEQSVSFFLEPVLKDAKQSILKQYADITLLQIAEQSRLL
jgi:DNA-binding IscR family transcriptional regulator